MVDVPIFTRRNHPAFNPRYSFLDYQRYARWDIAEWQAANRARPRNVPDTPSDRLRHLFFALLSGKWHWQPPTEKINGADLRRILVFRYDKIGDYICATPILRWLKAALPHIEIDMISSHANHSLACSDVQVRAAFPIHPDKSFDWPSWRKAIQCARQNQYDVIVATGHIRSAKAAVLATLISREAKKIAIEHDKRAAIYGLVFDYQTPMIAFEEHWGRTMLRAVMNAIEPVRPTHEADTQTYLSLNECDFDAIDEIAHREGLEFMPPKENLFLKTGSLENLPRHAGNPYCVVNVAASRFKPDCAWAKERVVEACQMLLRRFPDWFVFVTGAPAEKQVVQTVVETVRNARCQALMLPLLSAAAAISGAKFVLTPDTATVHIASAAGVPVVGLYATLRSIAEWYPYQSPFALLLSPNEGSINQIPIVRVSDAIEKLCEETQLCKKQARRLETQDIQPIL
ncbi:MAG: hypothetical protein NZM05_11515 [Chloroherpetonaceae bacterium]|nr:hypothetical protein [Chloroherpetonaceae bacterium]